MTHEDKKVKFNFTQFNCNSCILSQSYVLYMLNYVEAENGVMT